MRYKVTISKRAENNLDKIFDYLEDNWPAKIKGFPYIYGFVTTYANWDSS